VITAVWGRVVEIGRIDGGNGVLSTQPPVQVHVGATGRAKRVILLRGRLLAHSTGPPRAQAHRMGSRGAGLAILSHRA